jgi:apolipoprotein N-acyltransferase
MNESFHKLTLKYIFLVVFGLILALTLNPDSKIFLNFFCLIPFFWWNEKVSSDRKYLLYVFTILVFWNVGALFWIVKINWSAAIIIYLLNPIFQIIPFVFLRILKNKSYDLLSFISSWLAVEYIQQLGEFAFPYLILGNSLANYPFFIQFYEYAGVLGGSLLILLLNIQFYLLFKQLNKKGLKSKKTLMRVILITLTLIFPVSIGFKLYHPEINENKKTTVRAIHPYVDVRGEKYDLSNQELMRLYIRLSFTGKEKTTPDYIIWPETSIKDGGWSNNLNNNHSISLIIDSLKSKESINIITGAVIYEVVPSNPEKNANVRYDPQSDVYYKTYNSVLGIGSTGVNNLKVKDKLVPVEEKIPFDGKFHFLRKIVPSLGKYTFSSRRINQSTFKFQSDRILPLICFESLFSNYVGRNVKSGVGAIFIIINEGWFDNEFASNQFTAFGKVRAVENRKWIVRSSNFGTTNFINPQGIEEISLKSTNKDYIQSSIYLNYQKTFFNRIGIYLGDIALYSTFILILVSIINYILTKPTKS